MNHFYKRFQTKNIQIEFNCNFMVHLIMESKRLASVFKEIQGLISSKV